MTVKFPFALTIFGMILGVAIAIVFGVNEDLFKNKIKADLQNNTKIQSIQDDVAREMLLKTEADKNWRYYQRFHFHSTGIGSMALGSLLLLSFISAPAGLVIAASYSIALGGFLYPFVWLFSGIYGPEMGRSEAKEAFAVFGYMGGVFLLGLLLMLFLLLKYRLRWPTTASH